MNNTNFFKVIVVGSSNVGKTSLMNKFVKNVFTQCTKYTVGVDFATKNVVIDDDTIATLQIWDTAGQERFQSVCGAYYRGCDCCIIVYDVTDLHSFENLNYWYNQFIVNAAPKDKDNFPFVVVGNKVDLPVRQVSIIQAEEWCNTKNQCPYYETSAKDGINVDFVFEKAAEMAMSRVMKPKPYFRDFDLREKKKSCC